MASEQVKIEEVCRICGSGDNLCDIWLKEFNKTRVRLQAVVNVEDSNWLRFMCAECKAYLDDLWEFLMRCDDAYKAYKSECVQSCGSGDLNTSTKNSHEKEDCNDIIVKLEPSEETFNYRSDEENTPMRNSQENEDFNDIIVKVESSEDSLSCGFDDLNTLITNCQENKDTTDVNVKIEPSEDSLSCGSDVLNTSITNCQENKDNTDVNEDVNLKIEPSEEKLQYKAFEVVHWTKGGLKREFHIGSSGSKLVRNNVIKMTPAKTPYQCDTCGDKFVTKNELNIHINQFHPESTEGRYPCSKCDKTFKQKKYVPHHMWKCHPKFTRTCLKCNKKFESIQDYLCHNNLQNKTAPYYSCSFCKKKFLYKSALERHERFHTGDKPFKCEMCSKDFLDKAYFSGHMKEHMMKTDEDNKNLIKK